jgi:TRAP-type transport system small permease protein
MKQARASRNSGVLVVIGGGALMAAMAIDTLAVIGRHTGIPLLGSIELVQVLVGIAGAVSVVVATLNNSHAVVRILISRLGADSALLLRRLNTAISALLFVALAAGSVWIVTELWHSQEESELWRLPYQPLRLLISGAMVVTAALFARAAWRGEHQ